MGVAGDWRQVAAMSIGWTDKAGEGSADIQVELS